MFELNETELAILKESYNKNFRLFLTAVVVQRLERAVVGNNFFLKKKSSWSQKKDQRSFMFPFGKKKLSFFSECVGRFRETRVRLSPSALRGER